MKYLIKFQPKTIYIWTENQQHSKSISYILARKLSKDNSLKIKCISYIGYPYFGSFHPHLKPTTFELENEIWGKNCFMFCDYESLQEFEVSIRNISSKNIETTISREGLRRHKPIDLNLEKKFKFSQTRKFTLFSHSSINDFISLIRYIHFRREKINYSSNDKIYIRLHPTVSKKVVIKKIKKLNFFDKDTFIFLNPLEEQIDESILMSEYCIFSDSNLINRALLLNSKVIVCRISFFFDPPIFAFNKNNKNLTFL